MDKATFDALDAGDIIRNKSGTPAWQVIENHGDHVTAVRIMEACNPAEWDLVFKASHERIKP